MGRRNLKLLLVLVAFGVMTITYPHIRHGGRWTNNDFIHQIPKIAAAIDAHSVFVPLVSANSIFYPAESIILHHITGVAPPELLLFAIPFTAGGVSLLFPYLLFRRFANTRYALVGLALVVASPLLLDLRAGGKHSVFTFSLFFACALAISARDRRYRLLLGFLFLGLLGFHLYLAGIFLLFAVLYTSLTDTRDDGPHSTQLSRHGDLTAALSAGALAWVTFLVYTPTRDFAAFLFGILPPYPAAAGGGAAGEKAGSGVQQFLDVLSQRWEPWWVWLVLTMPLLLFLSIAFAAWLRSVVSVLRRERAVDVPLAMATTGGLLGIVVVGASVAGYSATNLIFRYLAYFIPWGILLIVARLPRWSPGGRQVTLVFVALTVVVGMVAAPVKVSDEPRFQSEPTGIYTEPEAAAIGWFSTHSAPDERLTVANTINADVASYLALRDYRPRSELPTTREDTPFRLTASAIQKGPRPPTNRVYDNHRSISTLPNGTA